MVPYARDIIIPRLVDYVVRSFAYEVRLRYPEIDRNIDLLGYRTPHGEMDPRPQKLGKASQVDISFAYGRGGI